MSGYSIFDGTVGDMTWPELEEAAKKGAIMLVPIGVIEQHGPHLPLATDIYAAHFMCSVMKTELDKRGILSVIAPPYYFGKNESTGMFPGSINIRPETMIAMLTDLFVSYKNHGFPRQFVMNHHGDPFHNDAVVQAIALAREQDVETVLLMGGLVEFAIERACERASVPLPSSAILKVEESDDTKQARAKLTKSEVHIHAEERETSLIMKWFPNLLKKKDEIKGFKPVIPTFEVFQKAEFGGGWRELSPLGYVGDPSVATKENAELYACESRDAAEAIANYLAQKK
jgi:creatinine amidohydrolase